MIRIPNIYEEIVTKSQKSGLNNYQGEELYDTAFAAFMVGDYDYAQQVSQRYKDVYPENDTIYDIDILCLGESGNFTQALSICENKGLDSLVSFLVQGNIYHYVGNTQKAFSFFSLGMKKYPNNHVLEYNYANILYSSGSYEDALVYYDASIQHGDYLYAYCKKLKILRITGHKEEFKQLYQEIEKKLQTNDIWDKNLIYGNLYYETQKFSEAIGEYEKYLEYRSGDFYTLNAIGDSYYKLGKYQESLEYYQKSLEINNKIPYTQNSISKCHLKLGNHQKAVNLLHELVKYNSQNFMSYFLLGKVYFKLKDNKQAYKYFAYAYTINPKHHMCLRYLKKLQQMNGSLISQFVGKNNLEFVLSSENTGVSKVLYRSFGDERKFKDNIYTYLSKNASLEKKEQEKIQKIFFLDAVQGNTFHFAQDSKTQRHKFYISLYHTSLDDALRIISEVKNILGIQEKYFLEKEFIHFDCLGFDIKNGKISLKIYEILKKDVFLHHLPKYISPDIIKEVGVLKDFSGRKKLFYRFMQAVPFDDFSASFDISGVERLRNNLDNTYPLQKMVKYYCIEGKKEELYFI